MLIWQGIQMLDHVPFRRVSPYSRLAAVFCSVLRHTEMPLFYKGFGRKPLARQPAKQKVAMNPKHLAG